MIGPCIVVDVSGVASCEQAAVLLDREKDRKCKYLIIRGLYNHNLSFLTGALAQHPLREFKAENVYIQYTPKTLPGHPCSSVITLSFYVSMKQIADSCSINEQQVKPCFFINTNSDAKPIGKDEHVELPKELLGMFDHQQ